MCVPERYGSQNPSRQLAFGRKGGGKRPRLNAATIATLTAATFTVLTELASSHPTGLGHRQKTRIGEGSGQGAIRRKPLFYGV
jgi:hypothetical protein